MSEEDCETTIFDEICILQNLIWEEIDLQSTFESILKDKINLKINPLIKEVI